MGFQLSCKDRGLSVKKLDGLPQAHHFSPHRISPCVPDQILIQSTFVSSRVGTTPKIDHMSYVAGVEQHQGTLAKHNIEE